MRRIGGGRIGRLAVGRNTTSAAGREDLLPCCHARVRDGQLAEARNSRDFVGVLPELGLVPRDAMARLLTR